MFGKKRKLINRVRRGLEKRTAKLDSDEVLRIYERTRVKMAVKKALDKMRIRDKEKRRKIHGIFNSMNNRIKQLVATRNVVSASDAIRRGKYDKFIADCMQELAEELGSKPLAQKFYFKYVFYFTPLNWKLKPEKKK